MKVKELINELKNMDMNLPVYVDHHQGGTMVEVDTVAIWKHSEDNVKVIWIGEKGMIANE